MYKDAFQNFNESHIIVLGFILFMLTFLGALTWTFLAREKSFYTKLSLQPLQHGDQE